jgi:hypothetical protein
VTAFDDSNLSSATRRLVHDAQFRARLTSSLLQSDSASSDAEDARNTIDAAVVEILDAAGLPRGPVIGPLVERFNRGWFGRKVEDCRLLIDVEMFSILPEDVRSDSVLRTWIHESLHARQPYSPGFRREWRETSGFEEGMVEGLTRLIAVERLGLLPGFVSYDFYVAAYRTLATVLGIDTETLWRELWMYPVGEIREMFLSVIERILEEQAQRSLHAVQRARLFAGALRYFSTGRAQDQPDETRLMATWRRAIE